LTLDLSGGREGTSLDLASIAGRRRHGHGYFYVLLTRPQRLNFQLSFA
jgi:hypothetical protein